MCGVTDGSAMLTDPNIIKCEAICHTCGVHFERNPHCHGDYHFTIYGYVLMMYCPECGIMLPYLSVIKDFDTISTKEKMRIAKKCATTFCRGDMELKSIARNIQTKNRKSFIKSFSNESDLPAHDVSTVMSNLGF